MKRRDLVAHLEAHGCVLVREGSNHSVYRNAATGEWSTVPRHREVKDELARKICRELSVPSLR
ncbi:MAG TPA: type II toxin-antitoxin system HicA family toxin [Thermoanaerobaculia bacterium]